jgi:hypothetical protein
MAAGRGKGLVLLLVSPPGDGEENGRKRKEVVRLDGEGVMVEVLRRVEMGKRGGGSRGRCMFSAIWR